MLDKRVRRMLKAKDFKYQVVFKGHDYANMCFKNLKDALWYKKDYSGVLKSNGYNLKGRLIKL